MNEIRHVYMLRCCRRSAHFMACVGYFAIHKFSQIRLDTLAAILAALLAERNSTDRFIISQSGNTRLPTKTVNRISYQGGVWGVFLASLPSLSLIPFSHLFPLSKVAPQIQLRNLGSAVSFPQRGEGENDICSHQTCFLGYKYTKNAFLVYLEPRERVLRLQMSSYFR